MILGYKAIPGETPYFFGKVPGPDGTPHDRRFVRILCGLILPQLKEQFGAVIVLGELFRSTGPIDLTGLAISMGSWLEIETALEQFRRDLKMSHIIVEGEENREVLRRIPGLRYAAGEVPFLTYAAPKHALAEIGRQKVNTLITEGRLHIEHLTSSMDRDPEQSAKALQCAVMYALENKTFYRQPRRQQGLAGLIGLDGL